MFAGIGGIDLGFQQAGFEIKWANENDKNAQKTYQENFSHKIYDEDVRLLNPQNLSKVDVITSGFPCQAFSVAGYQKGFDDDRGNLFFETLRFIKNIRPKAYLLENVKNLYNHDNGNTFTVIRDSLIDSGYSFIPKIINTKDYANIPQTRDRVYIVGFRNESDFNTKNIHDDNFFSSNFSFPEKVKLTKKIKNFLEEEIDFNKFYYDETFMKGKYSLLQDQITDPSSIYQWRRKYVRENKSKLCPTLTANMGTGGHNVPIIIDKSGIRKLTPRECARFQGFPDTYKFPEKMALGQIYKQVGNSVTVEVIRRIAEKIRMVMIH